VAETICIVDDEPAILNTLSSILEDEGYQVIVAKSGVEGMKIVRSDSPDLIILDIWMPEMDGLETLKRLRSQFPGILVVMMSGHGSIETAVKATKLGAYDNLFDTYRLTSIMDGQRIAFNTGHLSTLVR